MRDGRILFSHRSGHLTGEFRGLSLKIWHSSANKQMRALKELRRDL